MNLFPFVYDNQKKTFIILQFSYPNRLTHTHTIQTCFRNQNNNKWKNKINSTN